MAAQLAWKSIFLIKFAGRSISRISSNGGCMANYRHSFFSNSPNTTTITSGRPQFPRCCFTHRAASSEIGSKYLELTDEELMKQCEMDTFKSSGPGGQHRNKRESAVRLKHLPTGIISQVWSLFYSSFWIGKSRCSYCVLHVCSFV